MEAANSSILLHGLRGTFDFLSGSQADPEAQPVPEEAGPVAKSGSPIGGDAGAVGGDTGALDGADTLQEPETGANQDALQKIQGGTVQEPPITPEEPVPSAVEAPAIESSGQSTAAPSSEPGGSDSTAAPSSEPGGSDSPSVSEPVGPPSVSEPTGSPSVSEPSFSPPTGFVD